jgi:dihydropteroate synthase
LETNKNIISLRSGTLDFKNPKLMGILNLSQDSFFEGSRVSPEHIIDRAEQMIQDGADILDLGAQSTRPGSTALGPEEEITRLRGVVRLLKDTFPTTPISIDTYHGAVAALMLDEGADIINDVSGGVADPSMLSIVAKAGIPYILMHSPGKPGALTERTKPASPEVVIAEWLLTAEKAKSAGIEHLIFDPGFGFGKSTEENYEILKRFGIFKQLKAPLLAGISRKRFLRIPLTIDTDAALNATTALHMALLLNGANILRVHDVKEAKQCITLFELIQ